MIKRIGENINEGDIIEFNHQSEPLYIYHDGKLEVITPREYNICTVKLPHERFKAISEDRLSSQQQT